MHVRDMGKVSRSLFFEMTESNEQAMITRLSAAGINDITLNEVLILAALQMRGDSAIGQGQTPNSGGSVPRGMADKLLLHGYLENQGKPNDPDRAAIVLTSRGRLAVEVAENGALADRWVSFPFRPGDIVISAPSKSGTTWLQMICALLVFQTSDLPAPLGDLSPWLDDPTAIRHEVFERYIAQRHRRFIKTHRPLAGMPILSQVTYIVVGRNPLDVAVSYYHQQSRIHLASGGQDADQLRPDGWRPDDTPHEWLLKWIAADPASSVRPSPLFSILQHISDAWARRDEPNIVLTHYEDLSADLEGEMRFLAMRLGIAVSEELWPGLVKAATFEQMRAAADRIQPLRGLLEDNAAFFRRGTSGAGAELLTIAELASYRARIARVLEPDVLTWLQRPCEAESGARGATQ